MATYVYRPGNPHADENGFVEKSLAYMHDWANKSDPRMMKGNVPVKINFIGDEMPPTQHMCSGKMFTSKKKFRDETKAYGCIEVGNDKSQLRPRTPKKLDKRQRREDIKKAVHEIRNGRDIKKEIRKELAQST